MKNMYNYIAHLPLLLKAHNPRNFCVKSKFTYGIALFMATLLSLPSIAQVENDWVNKIQVTATSGVSQNQDWYGVRNIQTDTEGNVYTLMRINSFAGEVDVDSDGDGFLINPSPFVPANSPNVDLMISKHNSLGELVWAKSIGRHIDDDYPNIGSIDVSAQDFRIDNQGNLIVIGNIKHPAGLPGTSNLVDFDPGVNTAFLSGPTNFQQTKGFIFSWNSNGEFNWVVDIPLSQSLAFYGIDINNDHFYVTGHYQGSGTFTGNTMGMGRVFLKKYTLSGDYVWARRFGSLDLGSGSATAPTSIGVDQAGNSYIRGLIGNLGNVDFNPDPNQSNIFTFSPSSSGSSWNTFLVKFNDSGSFQWLRQWQFNGGGGQIWGSNDITRFKYDQGLQVDNYGNIFMAGMFRDTIDLNPDDTQEFLVSQSPFIALGSNSHDVYVLSLNSSGVFQWGRTLDLSTTSSFGFTSSAHRINIDNLGNIYLNGAYAIGGIGDLIIETNGESIILPTVNSNAFINQYIVKLSNVGDVRWAKVLNSTSELASAITPPITIDNSRNLFTCFFSSQLTIDPGPTQIVSTSSNLVNAANHLHRFQCPPAEETITVEGCEMVEVNDEVFTESGTYTQILVAHNDCDSILTIEVTILQPSEATISESGCESVTVNGETYTTNGQYTQLLTAANGCDSVLTINVSIFQPTSATINETACVSYTLNGEMYTSSGIYTQNLTNAAGCDSTLTLNLTINQPSAGSITESVCFSFTVNGQTYTESGVYTQNLTNAAGCDSTLTINLTVDDTPLECQIDCAGVVGGNAQIDECGDCWANGPDNPNWNSTCSDCANVPNGTAFLDNCGDCVGGTTGAEACVQDCAGVPGGNALVDACGDCIPNGSANPDWNASCSDCAGVPNGTAILDGCGDCVGGTTGLDPCPLDCAGVPGGNAQVDACGDCITNGPANPNWNASCSDCANVPNGTAFLDGCGDCVGGNTGNVPCLSDCAGVPGGNAQIDACGDCITNGPANPNWNASCSDCANVPNGTAFLDDCGICVGGTTGNDPCPADCAGVPGGNAQIDDCGDCITNGSANPDWNASCSDCAGVVNGTSEIDDCDVCLENGPDNPLWNLLCIGDFTFDINGTVVTEDGQPVKDAMLTLGNETYTTTANGQFSFEAQGGSSDIITAEKDINPRNGLSTFDLVLIQRHILGIEHLGSPYKKIAADANNNGQMEVGDIILLQRLLLHFEDDYVHPFTGAKVNTSWRFAKPGLEDPNPNSAVVPEFNEGLAFNTIVSDLNSNIIAIKVGDLNTSANGQNMDVHNDPELSMRSAWMWIFDSRFVEAGEEVEIQVVNIDYAEIEGFQAGIFSNGLHIKDIESESLPAWSQHSFNIFGDDQNTAIISWQNPGNTFAAGQPLFTIRLIATQSGNLADMLQLDNRILRTEAYHNNLDFSAIHLHANQTTTNNPKGDFALRHYPNPFSHTLQMEYTVQSEQTVHWSIYDLQGRLIYTVTENVHPGTQKLQWTPAGNIPAGTYTYRLAIGEEELTGSVVYLRE